MIRPATIVDLPDLEPLALEFYAASKHLGRFNTDAFIGFWRVYLKAGIGAVFVLEQEGRIVGAIGGLVFPEPYSGALVATELFWFAKAENRGSGMKLYFAFEEWARSKDCEAVRMVALSDSMPLKLHDVYMRLGFQEIEKHYSKPLKEAA